MKIEYEKPISIKVWFQGGSTSRNFEHVSEIEDKGSRMSIKYKDAQMRKRTAILFPVNLNMIEEI